MIKNVKKFRKNGFIVFKNFLNNNEVKKTLKIIDNIDLKEKKGLTLWSPHYHNKFFLDILVKKKLKNFLIPILNDPFYNSIDKNKPNYILSEYIAIKDKKFLNLHIDSWIPSPSFRTWMVQVLILLTDRKKEDGCTVVVKNSHRSDSYSDRKIDKYLYLEGKKGDVIIIDSRIWHGRNEGKNNKQNLTLCATLQSWFIKQRFDFTRYFPKKIFNKLNNEQKQLLGYCSIPPKNHHESTSSRRGYDVLRDVK